MGCERVRLRCGDTNVDLYRERGNNIDADDGKRAPEDHFGANHHSNECESGKMRRTFGMGRNMLGAVRRGIYTGGGLAGVDVSGWAGVGVGGGGGEVSERARVISSS